MRLYTVENGGKEYVAARGVDGRMYTLSSMGIEAADMNDLIDRFDSLKERLSQKLQESGGGAPALPETVRVLAPIPRPRQDLICLGVNYRAHIEETVDVEDFTGKTDAVYFSKRVNLCNAPGGVVPFYDFVDSLDYEVELGVIIGKTAFGITPCEAPDHIFGYTIVNDISARNLQFKHKQWYRGKSLDGYTPMGPCIVTADEIEDPRSLRLTCHINGQKRQDSSTAYMITTVEEAVAELSQGMTLRPGTVIATGTPGGVAMGMKPPVYLKSGDVIRCEISEIGVLENTVGE